MPDLSDLPRVDRRYVEAIVDRSLLRLGMEQVDLVQFHWWGLRRAALRRGRRSNCKRLRRAGKIGRIGLTNFDTPRVAELVCRRDSRGVASSFNTPWSTSGR